MTVQAFTISHMVLPQPHRLCGKLLPVQKSVSSAIFLRLPRGKQKYWNICPDINFESPRKYKIKAFNALTGGRVLKRAPSHFFDGSSNGAMSGGVLFFQSPARLQNVLRESAFKIDFAHSWQISEFKSAFQNLLTLETHRSAFRQSHRIVSEAEGSNDGLVSVRSSQWGTYKGTLLDVTHLDLINWHNRLRWLLWELSGHKRK